MYKTIKELDIYISDGNYSAKYPRSEEFVDAGIPFIRGNNMIDGEITDEDMYHITSEKHGVLLKGHVKAGDVLITTRGNIGQVAIVPDRHEDSNINAQIVLLRVKPSSLYNRYLLWALQSQKAKEQIESLQTGTALKQLPVGKLEQIKIKHIDLEKQYYVANVLDKVYKIIKVRRKELQELDNLIKSRFVELFGDPSSNPKGYTEKLLPEIAEYWNGLTYKPEDVSEEGTIVLRSSNIQNVALDFKDTVRVTCKIGANKYVQDNDILMCSRNGSARLVGKVALIKNLEEPMSFGAFMMVIRSIYYPYLMTYFQLPAFRSQITTGATTTINQITGRMLDVVKLPVPGLDEVSEFEGFVRQVDKLKFEVKKSLDETQNLLDSLMQQYFG